MQLPPNCHILILVSEGVSLWNVALEMGRRLVRSGVSITLATTASDARSEPDYPARVVRLARRYRSPARVGGPADVNRQERLNKLTIIQYLLDYTARRQRGIAHLNQDEYRKLLDETKPDMVLIDLELYAYVYTSHALGIHYRIFINWFCTLPYGTLPPVHTDLTPSQTTAVDEAWRDYHRRNWRRSWLNRLSSGFNSRQDILMAYARACGFPRTAIRTDGWPPLTQFVGVPILRMVPGCLEWDVPIPDGNHYVGTLVAPVVGDPIKALPSDLAAALSSARAAGRVIVYATFSTLHAPQPRFLNLLIEAFRGMSDSLLVLSTSKAPIQGVAESVPDNVLIRSWVPQREVLELADACIHHGGSRTLFECLTTATPQLIYYSNRYDHPGNAARAVAAGIARAGNQLDSARKIAARLVNILNNEQIKRQTRILAAEVNTPAAQERFIHLISECF